MTPRKNPKAKSSSDENAATSPSSRSPGRPRSTQSRFLSSSKVSINDRLIHAREFLHSEDPSTYPNFADQYHVIQAFVDDLVGAKELFDVNVYNDVKAMLRVHGDRMQEQRAPLNLRTTRSSFSPTTPSSTRIFSTDTPYENLSSATMAGSSHSARKSSLEENSQLHPYEEGELLTFNPSVFGSAAPGYRYPAPTKVMGFDPETGFARRRIHSSEEELYPGTESAEKRVMGQGFAQTAFSNTKKGTSPFEAETIPALAKENMKVSQTKGKGKAKEVIYPDIASNLVQKTQHPFKKIELATSPTKQLTPNPFSSTPAKRPFEEEEFFDPITLSNKHSKLPRFEADYDEGTPYNEEIYDPDAKEDDPAYNTDDLEADLASEDYANMRVGRPTTADKDERDELAMEIDEAVGTKKADTFENFLKELSKREREKDAKQIKQAASMTAATAPSLFKQKAEANKAPKSKEKDIPFAPPATRTPPVTPAKPISNLSPNPQKVSANRPMYPQTPKPSTPHNNKPIPTPSKLLTPPKSTSPEAFTKTPQTTPPPSNPTRTTQPATTQKAKTLTTLPTPPPTTPPHQNPPPLYPGSGALIPPEILTAPIHPLSTQTSTLHQQPPSSKFHPGSPIFLFGETNYLTALKSRNICRDLRGAREKREGGREEVMGMWARFRLPGVPVGWDNTDNDGGVGKGAGMEPRKRVKTGDQDKVGTKKDEQTMCVMS
ncbi:MAG: hypothetical protein L6R40_006665 [Gallowayella cf. fulva]|nr:MAG: hypothetical protein L6R40_006665 [Xanthomendoza cf. fulva]